MAHTLTCRYICSYGIECAHARSPFNARYCASQNIVLLTVLLLHESACACFFYFFIENSCHFAFNFCSAFLLTSLLMLTACALLSVQLLLTALLCVYCCLFCYNFPHTFLLDYLQQQSVTAHAR